MSSTRNPLSEKDIDHHALKALGAAFTAKFICGHKNKKLQSFSESAESCLDLVQDWNCRYWKSIGFLAAALMCWALSTTLFTTTDKISLASCVAALAIITTGLTYAYVRINLTYSRPSRTQKEVAQAWKKWRSIAIAEDVFDGLAAQIRGEAIHSIQMDAVCHRYRSENFCRALQWVLEERLRSVAKEFRTAEMHQHGTAAKKLRGRFRILDQLSQVLGFPAAKWEQLDHRKTKL